MKNKILTLGVSFLVAVILSALFVGMAVVFYFLEIVLGKGIGILVAFFLMLVAVVFFSIYEEE